MAERARRFWVEFEHGDPYEISWYEAESRLVDMQTGGVDVLGDLDKGYEYQSVWPATGGRVTVKPITDEQAADG